MTDRLDDLLRQAGHTYAAGPPAHGPRPDDALRRGRARRRTQRAVAGGLAAVALIVAAGALARSTEQAGERVTYGGDGRVTTVTTAPAPSTTGGTASTAPTTTGPTTTLGPSTTTAPTTTAPVAKPSGLRAVDWQNFLYPSTSCGTRLGTAPVPVYHGTFPVPVEQMNEPAVQVRGVQYADLTRDGTDEAVVSVDCVLGAKGLPTAWVYGEGSAGPTVLTGLDVDPASETSLGERYGITGFTLHDVTVSWDHVTTTWSGWRNEDAGCCPSFSDNVVLRHQHTGGQWTTTVERVG